MAEQRKGALSSRLALDSAVGVLLPSEVGDREFSKSKMYEENYSHSYN